MTREQAKELLPIITAYAEGKKIEYQTGEGNWENVKRGLAFTDPVSNYRIAPEKKYRPFTMEEFLPHKDRWVKIEKNSSSLFRITNISDEGVDVNCEYASWQLIFNNWEFENGEPCGVQE